MVQGTIEVFMGSITNCSSEIMFVAHSRTSDGQTQSVTEHLCGVARKSGEYAKKLDLQKSGELLGLLHDIGKLSSDFQCYIGASSGIYDEDADDSALSLGRRGKVDHSTAGAIYVAKLAEQFGKKDAYSCYAMALCLASHHSGLIDALSPDGQDTLGKRLEKSEEKSHYAEVIGKLPIEVSRELERLIRDPETWNEFSSIIRRVLERDLSKLCKHFNSGMVIKFLFSCLIDADRQDTADFQEPERVKLKNGGNYIPWEELARRLEARMAEFPKSGSVDKIRAEISAECLTSGSRGKGTYLLTVPTGGGKTLASLRFALRHARGHKMNHIFYVIPFTSIIDQNAQLVREILEGSRYGESLSGKIVLEHHSNLTPEEETSCQKVLAESWDAPIVFTTNVQFLESIFGHGTRDIRRLHQLANSVIIFDEAQTLPVRCAHLFANAVNFLVRECDSTVVLCTATQPILDKIDHNRGSITLSLKPDLMKDSGALFERLKRVKVDYERRAGGWTVPDIAARAALEAHESGSALVIANTKRSIKNLYLELKGRTSAELLHLSTNMCPAHRMKILRHIRWLLDRHQPLICVSTQLIEAGVDVDFGSVIRFMAGLDSIAQAAGRCNRNGLRNIGRVIVINPADENLSRLPDIRHGKECAERVMREFDDDCSRYDDDRIGLKAMQRFFELYFFARRAEMAYPVGTRTELGRNDDLLSLLSDNPLSLAAFRQESDGSNPKTPILQSFMMAGRVFETIDSHTQGVIVPYGEGENLITYLLANNDPPKIRQALKKAQRYSLNVFGWQLEKLIEEHAVKEIAGQGVYCLDPKYYNHEFGFDDAGNGKLITLIS